MNRLLLILCAWSWATAFSAAGSDDFFEVKVKPILSEHCYECHSSKAEKLKGGLHLDSRESLFRGGDSGQVIIPGQPDQSILVRAIEYGSDNLRMPPKERLPSEKIKILREWIANEKAPAASPEQLPASTIDYASARTNWAYSSPVDPPIPPVSDPTSPSIVDQFIRARLKQVGLVPNPPADKPTLLRRVTFDLIGLPPTAEELHDFLADDSAHAFERVVDRLLSSPHYGERWGRHWLDVVRYTDSIDSRGSGSEGDISEAYRYRDWVVSAFNRDLPWDQFILQQFAGDVLQPKSPEEIDRDAFVATTLFSIGEWGTGDADKEKMMTDIVDDQIDVTGRAFLGLTLACARCHDHKFDPISARDYYALAGIFFSSHIVANPGRKTEGTPVMRTPLAPPAEVERRKIREARIKSIDQEIDQLKGEAVQPTIAGTLRNLRSYLAAARAWKEEIDLGAQLDLPSYARHWSLDPAALERILTAVGLADLRLLSGLAKNIHGKAGLFALSGANGVPSLTVNSTKETLEFITIKMPPESVAVHPSPRAGVAVGFRAPREGIYHIEAGLADADPNCGDGVEWSLNIRAPGKLEKKISGVLENGRFEQLPGETRVFLRRGETLEFAIHPRGEYSCDTTTLRLRLRTEGETWSLDSDLVSAFSKGDFKNPSGVWTAYDLGAGSVLRDAAEGTPLVDWFDALKTQDKSAAWKSATGLQKMLDGLLAKQTGGAKSEELAKETGGKLFGLLIDSKGPVWSPLREESRLRSSSITGRLQTLDTELATLRAIPSSPFPTAHAMREGGVPESPHAGIKDARLHVRGRYDRLGEVVPRGVPVLLAENPIQITQGSGRLELAKWIASPENPLTARVIVNRIWQHHFGEGLVRTPNNFGKLGEPPTHPELLDWLAHRFVESGWSIKALQRLMLHTAVYQQSSQASAAQLEKDPDNRFLARAPRRRMEAEVLRDSILAVNGTLDRTVGGKNIREFNSRRRTLYQTTIRSVRNDYRALFDAADPTAIVEKRIVSTVAPQALFMLNHPFIAAETRQLAERVLNAAPRSDRARVNHLYLWLFAREASSREQELASLALERLFETSAGPFAERELAAWTGYCQILLASNEFSYID